MGPDGNKRVQPKQRWGGAQDGQVGPLPLRLDAEVLADFLKSRLDPPAEHEAAKNRLGFQIKIGLEKCPRFSLAGGITDQDPADRCRRPAAGVPNREARHILKRVSLSTIPLSHYHLTRSARVTSFAASQA
jgi:hypothetical protein